MAKGQQRSGREARKPKKEMVAAHLVNLAWNGLSGLEPKPRLCILAQNLVDATPPIEDPEFVEAAAISLGLLAAACSGGAPATPTASAPSGTLVIAARVTMGMLSAVATAGVAVTGAID